jgi:hypothetical protein
MDRQIEGTQQGVRPAAASAAHPQLIYSSTESDATYEMKNECDFLSV